MQVASLVLPHRGMGIESATRPVLPSIPVQPVDLMGRRGMSGLGRLGIIAEPTYPYDPHSVWNRNQLGDLTTSSTSGDLLNIAAVGLAFYVAWLLFRKGYMAV